ncbi:DUF6281 family protein [Prauserella alba]|uniref:DUF6281 family protein n=1 Tax=Prauserella alba TaxID=176898 RepID=UPI00355620E7
MSGRRGRLLAVSITVTLLGCFGTACQPGGSSTRESSVCALSVRFDGRTYESDAGIVPASETRRIGTGHYPPCDDASGNSGGSSPAKVAAIDGIDTATAVAVYNTGGWRALVPRGQPIPSNMPAVRP